MTLKAIFETAMFKPRAPIHLEEHPIRLEEHAEVEVVIPATAPSDADDPTGGTATGALIGFIDDAPADTAEHHDDEYLSARR